MRGGHADAAATGGRCGVEDVVRGCRHGSDDRADGLGSPHLRCAHFIDMRRYTKCVAICGVVRMRRYTPTSQRVPCLLGAPRGRCVDSLMRSSAPAFDAAATVTARGPDNAAPPS